MKSQTKLFVSIIASIIAICGLVGFSVVRSAQHDQPKIQEENRQYEASKNLQSNKTADPSQAAKQSNQQTVPLVEAPDAQIKATVYFSKNPDSTSNPTVVYAVERSLDSTATPELVVSQLIAGPTQDEKSSGFYGGIELTGASNCGNKDFKVALNGDSVTLQFCRDHVSGGPVQDAREQAQIVNSLKKLTGVTKVEILNQKNNCLFGANSLGVCVTETN